MSAEIRRLLEEMKRYGEHELGYRDMAVGEQVMEWVERLNALLPPAGSPPVEALVQQFHVLIAEIQRCLDSDHDVAVGRKLRYLDSVWADQLEAALKAAPPVRLQEDERLRTLRQRYAARPDGISQSAAADDVNWLLDLLAVSPVEQERQIAEYERQATLLREFCGWLSADIPELHQVEVPRLAESLDRFLAADEA